MAKFTIGGEVVHTSLPSFRELEAAWPYMEQARARDGDTMAAITAVLCVVAVGVVGAAGDDADLEPGSIDARVVALKRKLTPQELPGLHPALNELMIETGLAKAPGEAPPAEETETESPSKVTGKA
jgi:hypothetical protein